MIWVQLRKTPSIAVEYELKEHGLHALGKRDI